jgi:hypothetical protein
MMGEVQVASAQTGAWPKKRMGSASAKTMCAIIVVGVYALSREWSSAATSASSAALGENWGDPPVGVRNPDRDFLESVFSSVVTR